METLQTLHADAIYRSMAGAVAGRPFAVQFRNRNFHPNP